MNQAILASVPSKPIWRTSYALQLLIKDAVQNSVSSCISDTFIMNVSSAIQNIGSNKHLNLGGQNKKRSTVFALIKAQQNGT